MKGRLLLIEPLPAGGHAALLMVDGRIEDFLADPAGADRTPRPEAIFRAIPARPAKGLGGAMVDLGEGRTGFLRSRQPPVPGRPVLVQVSGWAEPGKAPPVGDRVRLKGRTAVLTPGAPGLNLSRSIRDPETRADLEAAAARAMAGAGETVGLILRTAAALAEPGAVAAEIAALRAQWAQIVAAATGAGPAALRDGPGARDEALRDWHTPGTVIEDRPGALADAGAWDALDAAAGARVPLGAGFLTVEPTTALVAIDVNTGGDLSPTAGLKVNLAAAREIPRQLRLRGLGGQVVVDFAPLAKTDRRQVEAALTAALRADGIETSIAGWTPLGHLELLRRRSRRPWQAGSALGR